MATKSPTTSTASPPTLGANRQTSSLNQPQKSQPGPRQPNPSEQPRPFSSENRPQRNEQGKDSPNQESGHNPEQKEQEYNYILSQARAERAQIKNAEDYRSHFKKSSGLLRVVAYICAILDYIFGFIEDTAVGAFILFVMAIVDVVLNLVPFYVNQNMKKMHSSMEGLIGGISASEQKTASKRGARIDRLQFAMEKIDQVGAKSNENLHKTSNDSSKRQTSQPKNSQQTSFGNSLPQKGLSKRSIKNGAKSFVGQMLAASGLNALPVANFYWWQLRAVRKMYKYERAMVAEGLALVDEYVAATKQELEANAAYANMIAEEFE